MARKRDPQEGAGSPATALPPPEGLSVYTFANRYHALRMPLWIGLAGFILILLHVGIMWTYIDQLSQPDDERLRWYMISTFDLDSEESFGTYLSALLLLFIGRLLWHQGKQTRRAGEIWCAWWFLLAVLFYAMAIEEVIDSQRILTEYKQILHDDKLQSSRPEGFWAAMFIGAACVPFLWEMRWRFSLFAVGGGVVYLLGALGVDAWTPNDIRGDYVQGSAYYLWTALEEGLEILGPLLFLHGFLAWSAKSPTGVVVEATEITE